MAESIHARETSPAIPPLKPKSAEPPQQAQKQQDDIVRTALAAALIAILKSTPPAR